MNADAYIKAQVAAYAMQQGLRHGGINNAMVVAHVLANRVKAGWYGGAWMQVLEYARDVEANDYSQDPQSIDLQKLPVKKVLERVDDIYAGLEPDVFSGGRALYYADMTGQVHPWFVEKIIRQPDAHQRIGNVGTVTLFT